MKGKSSALLTTASQYSDITTVHGVNYVFRDDAPVIDRLLWALAVVGMLVASITLGVQFLDDYNTHRVVNTLGSTTKSVTELPFPAITICRPGLNMEAVKKAIELDYRQYLADTETEPEKNTPVMTTTTPRTKTSIFKTTKPLKTIQAPTSVSLDDKTSMTTNNPTTTTKNMKGNTNKFRSVQPITKAIMSSTTSNPIKTTTNPKIRTDETTTIATASSTFKATNITNKTTTLTEKSAVTARTRRIKRSTITFEEFFAAKFSLDPDGPNLLDILSALGSQDVETSAGVNSIRENLLACQEKEAVPLVRRKRGEWSPEMCCERITHNAFERYCCPDSAGGYYAECTGTEHPTTSCQATMTTTTTSTTTITTTSKTTSAITSTTTITTTSTITTRA